MEEEENFSEQMYDEALITKRNYIRGRTELNSKKRNIKIDSQNIYMEQFNQLFEKLITGFEIQKIELCQEGFIGIQVILSLSNPIPYLKIIEESNFLQNVTSILKETPNCPINFYSLDFFLHLFRSTPSSISYAIKIGFFNAIDEILSVSNNQSLISIIIQILIEIRIQMPSSQIFTSILPAERIFQLISPIYKVPATNPIKNQILSYPAHLLFLYCSSTKFHDYSSSAQISLKSLPFLVPLLIQILQLETYETKTSLHWGSQIIFLLLEQNLLIQEITQAEFIMYLFSIFTFKSLENLEIVDILNIIGLSFHKPLLTSIINSFSKDLKFKFFQKVRTIFINSFTESSTDPINFKSNNGNQVITSIYYLIESACHYGDDFDVMTFSQLEFLPHLASFISKEFSPGYTILKYFMKTMISLSYKQLSSDFVSQLLNQSVCHAIFFSLNYGISDEEIIPEIIHVIVFYFEIAERYCQIPIIDQWIMEVSGYNSISNLIEENDNIEISQIVQNTLKRLQLL